MMRRWFGSIGALCVAAALAACGGGGPTATTQTAATAAPAATVTVAGAGAAPATVARATTTTAATGATATRTATTARPATATRTATTARAATATRTVSLAATRTATAAGGAEGTYTDPTGTCRAAVPAGFGTFPGAEGVFTDRTALLTLTRQDTGGQPFAAWAQTIPTQIAATPQVQGFMPGRTEQRDDFYRLDYTLAVSSLFPGAATGTAVAKPGPGTTACLLQVFWPQGQEARYGPVAEAAIARLTVVQR